MNSDKEAIQLAAKTVVRVKPEDLKIVRIANTLEIVDIQVSFPMLKDVLSRPEKFEVVGGSEQFKFDKKGNLYPMLGHVQNEKLLV